MPTIPFRPVSDIEHDIPVCSPDRDLCQLRVRIDGNDVDVACYESQFMHTTPAFAATHNLSLEQYNSGLEWLNAHYQNVCRSEYVDTSDQDGRFELFSFRIMNRSDVQAEARGIVDAVVGDAAGGAGLPGVLDPNNFPTCSAELGDDNGGKFPTVWLSAAGADYLSAKFASHNRMVGCFIESLTDQNGKVQYWLPPIPEILRPVIDEIRTDIRKNTVPENVGAADIVRSLETILEKDPTRFPSPEWTTQDILNAILGGMGVLTSVVIGVFFYLSHRQNKRIAEGRFGPEVKLEDFTDDLVEQAKKDLARNNPNREINEIIGRDNEAIEFLNRLARPEYSNPFLLGESGSGKDMIVKRAAQLIALRDHRIPDIFLRGDIQLRYVDPTAFVATEGVVGSNGRRVKLIEDAMKKGNKFYFPELADSATAGAHSRGTAEQLGSLLKSILDKPWSGFSASTTPDGYQVLMRNKYFKDLFRRQPAQRVEPMSPDIIRNVMTTRIAPWYASHDSVTITPEALETAIRMGYDFYTKTGLAGEIGFGEVDACKQALSNGILEAMRESGWKKSGLTITPDHIIKAAERALQISIPSIPNPAPDSAAKTPERPGGPTDGSPVVHRAGLVSPEEFAATLHDFIKTTEWSDVWTRVRIGATRTASGLGEFAKGFVENLGGLGVGFGAAEFLSAAAQAAHFGPIQTMATVLGGTHVVTTAAANVEARSAATFFTRTLGAESWRSFARGMPSVMIGMAVYDQAINAAFGENGGGAVGDFARFGGTRFAVGGYVMPQTARAAVGSITGMLEKRVAAGAAGFLTRGALATLSFVGDVAVPVVGWGLMAYETAPILALKMAQDDPNFASNMKDAWALHIYRAHKIGDAEAEKTAWTAAGDPYSDIDMVDAASGAELDAARVYVNGVIMNQAKAAREQLMSVLQMKMLGYASEAEQQGLASNPAQFMNTVLSKMDTFMSGLEQEVEFNSKEVEYKNYIMNLMESGTSPRDIFMGLIGGSNDISFVGLPVMRPDEATAFLEKLEVSMLQKTMQSIAELRPPFTSADGAYTGTHIPNEDLWNMIQGYSDSDGYAQTPLATPWRPVARPFAYEQADGSITMPNVDNGVTDSLFGIFLKETNAAELLGKMIEWE